MLSALAQAWCRLAAVAIGRMFESANARTFAAVAIGRGFEVAARGRAFVTDTVVVQ